MGSGVGMRSLVRDAALNTRTDDDSSRHWREEKSRGCRASIAWRSGTAFWFGKTLLDLLDGVCRNSLRCHQLLAATKPATVNQGSSHILAGEQRVLFPELQDQLGDRLS